MDDELDVTRRFIIWLNGGDLSDLSTIVAPHAVYSFNGMPLRERRILERRAAAFRAGAPDAQIVVDDVVGGFGGRVAVRYTVTGTHTGPLRLHLGELPPTGRRFEYSGAIFVTVEEGLVTSADLVSNMESALRGESADS
jgi:predicted ester cyclase